MRQMRLAGHFPSFTCRYRACAMKIRLYKEADLPELVRLFHDTVHLVNIRHYSPEQVNVWAPEDIDYTAWHRSLSIHYTLVALDGDRVVGFGDIADNGYLDRLYVHHAYQRQGIGSALCDKLEGAVAGQIIYTHASITAAPFFRKRGYKVMKQQTVVRNGVELVNYVMELQRTL